MTGSKRREIFAGNWKMYKDHGGALELVQGLLQGLETREGREYLIFPPAVYLREISELCSGSMVQTGIQNVYFEKEGAFTGEISVDMARDCGCDFVLIGHSERRHVFKEENSDINKKVKAVLQAGLTPLLCVGELLGERESGRTESVLKEQISSALDGLSEDEVSKMVIAYEPVWAIGTGKVATPEIASESHSTIRKILAEIYDGDLARSIPILYGGSVKPDNIAGLHACEEIDGVLVGGASLEVDSFLGICNV